MENKIKVGFCVAYDWDLLSVSLPQIYSHSDEICISIDLNHTTWAGNHFDFDVMKFHNLISLIDVDSKIKIYKDNFYNPTFTPMQNEVRQRNMIADFLGKESGWHIQLDADEYFLDFPYFVSKLKSIKLKRNVNVCCPFIVLFKQTANGFLYIKNSKFKNQELIPIATNRPQYEFGRKNGYFNIVIDSAVIHQSWARSNNEILQKLENWGHNQDFQIRPYFDFWSALDESNYQTCEYFHPFIPSNWEKLDFISSNSIKKLIENSKTSDFFKLSKLQLFFMNSIWISRIKKLVKNL